jgi:hypothetical protein
VNSKDGLENFVIANESSVSYRWWNTADRLSLHVNHVLFDSLPARGLVLAMESQLLSKAYHVTISDAIFQNGEVKDSRGGAIVAYHIPTITMDHILCQGNDALTAACIYVEDADRVMITNSELVNNTGQWSALSTIAPWSK